MPNILALRSRGTLWLGAALALLWLSRAPYLHHTVLNEDEAVYLYAARATAEQGFPYVTAFDHKGPLLYYAYLPAVWLGPEGVAPLRAYTSLLLVLTAFFVYALGRRFVGLPAAALGAVLYGMFFTRATDGLASNAELFMMLPATACLWAWLRAEGSARGAWLVLSGALGAAAFFVKATALFTVGIPPLVLLATAPSTGARVRDVALWGLGGVGLTGALFALFGVAGHGALFWDAYFALNSRYTAFFDFKSALYQYLTFLGEVLTGTTTGVLGTVSLAFLLAFPRRLAPFHWKWLGATTALGLLGVFAAKQISAHYFLQLALPLALWTAAAADSLPPTELRRTLTALAVVGALLHLTAFNRGLKTLFFGPQPPLDPHYEIAQYIRSHSEPNDPIFIAHGSAVLYHLTGRRFPGRFFHFYQHAIPMRLFTDAQSDWERAVAAAPPKLILSDESPPSATPYIQTFIDSHYARVDRVGSYDVYAWKTTP